MNKLFQLAISDEGFIFDPTTGESFGANQTGIYILKELKENKSVSEIVMKLMEHFEVSQIDAERDIQDFIDSLRLHKLITKNSKSYIKK